MDTAETKRRRADDWATLSTLAPKLLRDDLRREEPLESAPAIRSERPTARRTASW